MPFLFQNCVDSFHSSFFKIQKEQTENKKLQKRVEEMERAVRGMEDKFE